MIILAFLPIFVPVILVIFLMAEDRKRSKETREWLESGEYKKRVRAMAACHLVSWGFPEQALELLEKKDD